MRLCRTRGADGRPRVGVVEDGMVRLLSPSAPTLGELLARRDPAAAVKQELASSVESTPLDDAPLLAPIDRQDVWAAGVTYQRSQKARMDESEQAASFYDKVYSADRPEIFFKATPRLVSGPKEPIHIRRDTKWCVPEPELTLAIAPDLRIVGFTVGNDMSARDIEGENPLYLPQAKMYDRCAGLGPVVTLAEAMPPIDKIEIALIIRRHNYEVFKGKTSTANLNRKLDELVDWLARETTFPDGAFLMTGTGIVPPDDFTCEVGDEIEIRIDGIGSLINPVTTA